MSRGKRGSGPCSRLHLVKDGLGTKTDDACGLPAGHPGDHRGKWTGIHWAKTLPGFEPKPSTPRDEVA